MAAVMLPSQPIMGNPNTHRASMVQPKARHPKLRSSCDNCQATKVKCSKDKPSCRRCSNQGVPCVYGISRRMGRPRPSNKDGVSQNQKSSLQQQRQQSKSISRQSSISSVPSYEPSSTEYFSPQISPQKPAGMGPPPPGPILCASDNHETKFNMDDLLPKLPPSISTDWTGFDPALSPKMNEMSGPFSFDPMMSTLGLDPSTHFTDSPCHDVWMSSFCNDFNVASPSTEQQSSSKRQSISSSAGCSSMFESCSPPSSAAPTPSMRSTGIGGTVSPQMGMPSSFFDMQAADLVAPGMNPLLDMQLGGESNVATPTGQSFARMNSICSTTSTASSSTSSNTSGYANYPFSPNLSRTTSSVSSNTSPPSSNSSQAGGDCCTCQNTVLDILTQMHASDHNSASLDTILRLEQTAEEQILRMLNCYDCLESRRNLLLVSLIISNVVHLFEIATGSLTSAPGAAGKSLAPQEASGANEFASQLETLIAAGPSTGATDALDQHQHGQISEQQWRELVRRLIQVRLGKVYNLLNRLGTSMDGESRATCSDTLMDLHKRLRLVLGKVEMGGGMANL